MKRLVKMTLLFIVMILCYVSIIDKISVLKIESDTVYVLTEQSTETTSGWNKYDSPCQPVAELGGVGSYSYYSSVLRTQKAVFVKYIASIRKAVHTLSGYDTILSKQSVREADSISHNNSLTPGDYFVITLRRLLI